AGLQRGAQPGRLGDRGQAGEVAAYVGSGRPADQPPPIQQRYHLQGRGIRRPRPPSAIPAAAWAVRPASAIRAAVRATVSASPIPAPSPASAITTTRAAAAH